MANIFDNGDNSPDKGQEDNATEDMQSRLEQKLRGEDPDEGEQNQPEQQPESGQDEQSAEEQQDSGEQLLAGKFRTPEELEKGYKNLEKKLGQRSKKAKQWEKWENFLKQQPEAAEVVKEISQNPNFKQLYQQYKNGNLDPNQVANQAQNRGQQNSQQDRLSKLRERLNRKRGQQNQPSQQPQQQQNSDLEQRLKKIEQMQQQQLVSSVKQNVQQDYNRLESQYGNILGQEGLDMEDLVQIASNHNLTKNNQSGVPVPDVEAALKVHMVNNPQNLPDAVTALQQLNQQTQQQTEQQKQQSQAESSSPSQNNQEQQEPSPEDQIRQQIVNVSRHSGSGFPQ